MPVRTSTPVRTATRSSATRSASSPPTGYQQPKRASTWAMQASVAGARYGDDPEYVAYRPAHCTRRGSSNVVAASLCSDRSGSMVSSSRGERIRRARPSGPDIGPARNVRALMSQIRRPCSSKRRHASPAPALKRSNASIRAPVSSGTTSDAPSGQRYVYWGSRRCNVSSSRSDVPATWNSGSKTWGSVTSDGPASNVAPSWRTVASLPPVVALRSSTTTRRPLAARRMATANPPTPAPTTTTSARSATRDPQRGQRSERQRGGAAHCGDDDVAEERREADRLHHRHPRVLGDQRTVRVGRREHELEDRHDGRGGHQPPGVVRHRDAAVPAGTGPAPVTLGGHLRVEEQVPARQRDGPEGDASRSRGAPTERRVRGLAGWQGHPPPRRRHDDRHARDRRAQQ